MGRRRGSKAEGFDYDAARADLWGSDAEDPDEIFSYTTREGIDHHMRENGLDPDKYYKRGSRGGGSGSSHSSGGCYLTTACVQAKGLPDDCAELETLRAFRDGYMAAMPGGERDIEAYYRMAPQVTRAIDLQPDAPRLWQEVYDGLVAPCVELIKNGRNEEAYRRYKACALALHEKYVR